MENKIKEIVAEIVEEYAAEIMAVGLKDNLLELGVDSMNSIEIVVELEEKFGVEIDIEELTVENIGTIEGLVELVKNAQN